MKKKALSYFLILILVCGILPLPAAASFGDITDPDTALAAAALESMGIVNGTSAHTYSPDSPLTRAQFCALAVRAMGMEDQVTTNGYKALFSDAKPGSWYTGYVNLAYSEKIINGYGNGRFGPEDGVTYGQVVTILLRMLGYTADDVGRVWPMDYVNYARDLGLSEGLSLDPNAAVNRGQAAELLFNMLGTEVKDGNRDYYETISGVASTGTAVILDNDAANAGASRLLMACDVGAAEASVSYYSQKVSVSEDLVSCLGTLLFNGAGKVIGFMPSGSAYADITVSSAKASGITASSGVTHRITGSAQVIYNGSLYPYNDSGYIMVNNQAGKSVRVFYDDDGAANYIYISSGSTSGNTDAIVAESNSAAGELAHKLGISAAGYSITKNGAAASADDLARYDVAYYDGANKTLCASDYRVSGIIQAASPSVDAAETITVAGCTLDVLECAWDTLGDFSLGNRVTLLLTDDCKVAACFGGTFSADMTGVLATDGSCVTLCGSGLILTGNTLSASANLRGALVKVTQTAKDSLSCSAFGSASSAGRVDIPAGTVGTYELAPGCAIYEWTGSSAAPGYVYSLSGELGQCSADFGAITWTESLSSSCVSGYRLNSAGQVDILLLKDVTGNCYAYGKLQTYSGAEGINLGDAVMPAFNSAVTITNSDNPGGSAKYLFAQSFSGTYGGIALSAHNSGYLRVAAVSDLTNVSSIEPDDFYQDNDVWYVTADAYELPVSEHVQVYIEATGKWYDGASGLMVAISSGMPLKAYYDRTFTTGAQIRVVVVGTNGF